MDYLKRELKRLLHSGKEYMKPTIARILKKLYDGALEVPLLAQLIGIKGYWETLKLKTACLLHESNPFTQEEYQTIRTGKNVLECGCKFELVKCWNNKVVDAYIDALLAHNNGTQTTPGQDLEILYIAVGVGDVDPDAADTTLENEFYRDTETFKVVTGRKIVFEIYIDPATANPSETTVAAPIVSTTVFDVASASGIANDDRIMVIPTGGSGKEFVKVLTIVGTTITLDTTNGRSALSVTPTVGDVSKVVYREYGAFAGAATASADTGLMVNHSLADHEKDSKGTIVRLTLSYLSRT